MKPENIKFYPLPNGEFVVSYWDPLKRARVQNTYSEESKATEVFNELRMQKPLKESKRSLKDCSIEELMRIYVEEIPEASLNKSPQLMKDFLELFAVFKCNQIDEIAMRCFYQRQKLEYGYTGYSLSTRKYQIQGFFKWMKSRGIIADSPQSKISMGRSKVYRRPPIWVKPAEIAETLNGAKMRSPGFLYPILLLISETAAKTMDIINMKWKDLDLKTGRLTLHEGDKIQARNFVLSDEAIKALKNLENISDHVFTNLEGRPLMKEVLTRELRILKRQLGIEKDWVFRDLRHSFAVNYLKAGGDIHELQKIMGHQHVRMTKEIYGQYRALESDFFEIEVVPETGTSLSENNKYEEF